MQASKGREEVQTGQHEGSEIRRPIQGWLTLTLNWRWSHKRKPQVFSARFSQHQESAPAAWLNFYTSQPLNYYIVDQVQHYHRHLVFIKMWIFTQKMWQNVKSISMKMQMQMHICVNVKIECGGPVVWLSIRMGWLDILKTMLWPTHSEPALFQMFSIAVVWCMCCG